MVCHAVRRRRVAARSSRDSKTLFWKRPASPARSEIWSSSIEPSAVPRVRAQLGSGVQLSLRYEFFTDGETLYFPVNRHEGDVWLMRLMATPE